MEDNDILSILSGTNKTILVSDFKFNYNKYKTDREAMKKKYNNKRKAYQED